jgi:hypothetical protein
MAEEAQNRMWKSSKFIHSNELSSCVELEGKLPVDIRREKAIPPAPGSVCNERNKG